MNRFLSVMAFAASLSLFGCRDTDVGRDCQLVKSQADGGQGADPVFSTDITEPAKDVISFGALDCEDLICVRAGNTPLPDSPTQAVFGKCSRACALGSACPAYDASLDKNPETAFSCRSLLLDEATLKALQENPDTQKYFRDRNTQYFCAQANSSINQ